MTTFLIIALVVVTLLCLALIRVVRRYERDRECDKEWRNQRDGNISETRRYASEITLTLNEYTGGISKRLSESEEIVETLLRSAPELFTTHTGLIYWLHANDQFLERLASVAAEGIASRHRESIQEQKKQNRESIFTKVYESSGLQPPPLVIKR